MYQDNPKVTFPGGVHLGTLDALKHFSPHGLTVGGLDPGDANNWQSLMEQYRDPQSTIPIAVNHPNDQTARDIGQIAKHTIWQGRNLWPGRQIPPEAFNQGANFLREHEGLPREEPQEPLQMEGNVQVKSDMSVTLQEKISNWQIVAMGELQQPGAVGATQDGPPGALEPSQGPDFSDNAQNSYQQEMALETWVNLAVDLLNRGEDHNNILAKLAHDGCPDPEAVMTRALKQPNSNSVSDDLGQDPFENPPPSDANTGQLESVSQQPPVLGSKNDLFIIEPEKPQGDEQSLFDVEQGETYPKGTVYQYGDLKDGEVTPKSWNNDGLTKDKWNKVKAAGRLGTILGRWEDIYGTETIKVAFDDGQTADFTPDSVQEVEPNLNSPVSEIQEFIDSLPVVEPSRPAISARISNLEQVRRVINSNINKVSYDEQMQLRAIDDDCELEISQLRGFYSAVSSEDDQAYLSNLSHYQTNGFNLAEPLSFNSFEGNPKEAGMIWASESPYYASDDPDDVAYSASRYAHQNNMDGNQTNEFLYGVNTYLSSHKSHRIADVDPEFVMNDGDASELFL